MKERPILFSGRLVRAILEGRKTQTRRIVKPQPTVESLGLIGHAKLAGHFAEHVFGACMAKLVPSPYGAPGDRLWCRETWYCDNITAPNWNPGKEIEATPELIAEWRESLYYRADAVQTGKCCELIPECACGEFGGRSPWKPSIHMPRWASRISLAVTSIRVERLQAITEEDAKAEGVEPLITTRKLYPSKHAAEAERISYRDGFASLWDSINGKPRPMLDDDGRPVLDDNEHPIMIASRSWASNPWVWCVAFSRVEAAERAA